MDDEERLAAVGATAVTVAVCRAEEGRRPTPWFVDPLAEHVARIAEPAREMTARPGLVFWVALRTRFFDELVTDAVTAQGIRQVVLLGAGLDARAFRLAWPSGSTVFELDRASVLELKHRLTSELGLVARCERRSVVADVIDDDWPALLAEQGWNSGEPTCWIAEGLLVYLDPGARDVFVAKLASIGGRLGTTLTSSDRAAQVELFRSGVDGRPDEWLRNLGWQATITRLGDIAERYGRPLSAKAATSSAALLVDAHT
ncbi:MAG: SAM-dependent methyltransferase [Acidothermaceae bacterium]